MVRVALSQTDPVHRLGVDSQLLFTEQMAVVARSAFAQLYLVPQLHLFLDWQVLVTITHVLVISRLDYDNVLYMGLPLKNIWKLLLV